jgi:plasmid stabilization system protein ParE
MDFRVELSDQAQRDITAIHDWLRSQQAGDAGERWFVALRAAIASLANLPSRYLEGQVAERSIDVGGYGLAYDKAGSFLIASSNIEARDKSNIRQNIRIRKSTM